MADQAFVFIPGATGGRGQPGEAGERGLTGQKGDFGATGSKGDIGPRGRNAHIPTDWTAKFNDFDLRINAIENGYSDYIQAVANAAAIVNAAVPITQTIDQNIRAANEAITLVRSEVLEKRDETLAALNDTLTARDNVVSGLSAQNAALLYFQSSQSAIDISQNNEIAAKLSTATYTTDQSVYGTFKAAMESFKTTQLAYNTTNDGAVAAKLSTASYNSDQSAYGTWKASIDSFKTTQLSLNTTLQGNIDAKLSTATYTTDQSVYGAFKAAMESFKTTQLAYNTTNDGAVAAKLSTASYNSDQSAYGTWKAGIDSFKTTQLSLNTTLQGNIDAKLSTATYTADQSVYGTFKAAMESFKTTQLSYNLTNDGIVAAKASTSALDSLSATVAGNEAVNTTFRNSQANTNSAQATFNTNLVAKTSLGKFQNVNAGFDTYSSASGVPDTWSNWSNGQFASRVSDGAGGYAMQLYSNGGDNVGISKSISIPKNSTVVFEARVKLVSGTFRGAGLLWSSNVDSYGFMSFYGYQDPATGTLVNDGVVGQEYLFSSLYKNNSPTNLPIAILYAMNHYTGMASNGDVSAANNLIWYEVGWRFATQAEIQANKALGDAMSAKADIVTLQSTKVDAGGAYSQAQNAITATFGGAMAGYKAVIDAATTNNSSNASAISVLTAQANNAGNGDSIVSPNRFEKLRNGNIADWSFYTFNLFDPQRNNYDLDSRYTQVTDADKGKVMRITSTSAAQIFGISRGSTKLQPTKTYKIQQSVKAINSPSYSGYLYTWLAVYNSAGDYLGVYQSDGRYVTNANWNLYSNEVTTAQIVASYPTAAYIAPTFAVHAPAAGYIFDFEFYNLIDFTDVKSLQTSVSIVQTAIAQTNGKLEGRLAMSVDAGGIVTGIDILSMGGTNSPVSKIKFTAAKAEFSGDVLVDGTLTANKIAAGTITADRLILGGITTDRIAPNAITATTAITSAGDVAVAANFNVGAYTNPPPNYTEIQAATLTTIGGGVLVNWSASVLGNPAGAVGMIWWGRLKRDGNVIADFAMVFQHWLAATMGGLIGSSFFDPAPSAGSHTYSVELALIPVSNQNPQFKSCTNRTLSITELKK